MWHAPEVTKAKNRTAAASPPGLAKKRGIDEPEEPLNGIDSLNDLPVGKLALPSVGLQHFLRALPQRYFGSRYEFLGPAAVPTQGLFTNPLFFKVILII